MSKASFLSVLSRDKTLDDVKFEAFWGSDLFTCMLCSFCPRTIWATSLGFCRNRPESSADNVQGMWVKRSDPQKDQNFSFSRQNLFSQNKKFPSTMRQCDTTAVRIAPLVAVSLVLADGLVSKCKLGRKKAGPQKTGPGSQGFSGSLRNLWGSA